MEVPFRVLNTFRRGVILQSIPEAIVIRLEPGDVVTLSAWPKDAALDIRTGSTERDAAARVLPKDGNDPADWRHDMTQRRTR